MDKGGRVGDRRSGGSHRGEEKRMDQELLELQRQFEAAQQAKSSVRLSERNVVELVTKLQELSIIDFDLIHTSSGKEYITLVLSLFLLLFLQGSFPFVASVV